MKRILVAGIGNVLRGDDGFGIATLERLKRGPFGRDPLVRFWESGIAGVSLVQELMEGFDVLVVLDAVDRGGAPGEVFVLEPDLAQLRRLASDSGGVDLHDAGPEGVFLMAAAAGALPEKVYVVGAQIVSCDDLGARLTPSVESAVEDAARRVESILSTRASGIALVDEILQILFWLRGEGLAKDASPTDLERWVSPGSDTIASALHRMTRLGLVEEIAPGRFRLTEQGAREGGRRFQDEFSDMTKPGHWECGDPDCECFQTGDPADCRHNVA